LHKLYTSSALNIISKLLSKLLSTETAKKYENFNKKIEKIGSIYLISLIIINVVFILFYIFMIIYANVELSNNIEDYIHIHLNMKKNIIMLLLVKPKRIVGGSPLSNIESNLGSGSSSISGGTDEIAKSMMGIDIDLAKISSNVISKIVNSLNYVFEPVQHPFTNEIMSIHIQNISLFLFILTALILIFFISFLFNLTLFIFNDRLINYFKNKYII